MIPSSTWTRALQCIKPDKMPLINLWNPARCDVMRRGFQLREAQHSSQLSLMVASLPHLGEELPGWGLFWKRNSRKMWFGENETGESLAVPVLLKQLSFCFPFISRLEHWLGHAVMNHNFPRKWFDGLEVHFYVWKKKRSILITGVSARGGRNNRLRTQSSKCYNLNTHSILIKTRL